jgi:hypothetical protein
MGQPALAIEDFEHGGKLPPPQRDLGEEIAAAAMALRDRGFYNPPTHMRRRAQAEGALEWLVNFVALTQPELLPTLGLPEQWVGFMLDQNDDQRLEAQRMVYLAQLATPERLAMLARGRAAAMLYDAVTPQDWYYASRALGHLPKWVIGEVKPEELMEEETERRAQGRGPRAKVQVGSGGAKTRRGYALGSAEASALPADEEVRLNRAQRRRLEKMTGKG